jgi:hypothetical protein
MNQDETLLTMLPTCSTKHCFPPLLFYFNHSSGIVLELTLHQGVQLKNGYQILLRQGQGNSSPHRLQMCRVVTLGGNDN